LGVCDSYAKAEVVGDIHQLASEEVPILFVDGIIVR
jgi:hypothetical protein